MTILSRLPTSMPQPYAFVEGSREILDKVVYQMEVEYGQTHPAVVTEWKQWAAEVAPKSDDVHEYLRDHSLHVPLGNILFNDEPVDQTTVVPLEQSALADLERMRATDCVQWSRWGFARDKGITMNNMYCY